MTIAINPATVADSIAALTVSGVTIKSLTSIPQSPALLCPILFPQADNFITDITSERVTFGSNGLPKIDFSYTLNYVFLYAPHGGGLATYDYYSPMFAKLELILEAIMSNDVIVGLVDINLNSLDAVGVIESQDGERYWGALLSFRCMEYVNG